MTAYVGVATTEAKRATITLTLPTGSSASGGSAPAPTLPPTGQQYPLKG